MDSFRTLNLPLRPLVDQNLRTPQDSPPENADRVGRIAQSSPRTSRPLKPTQVDALVAGYGAGRSMKELAIEFDINRLTVSAHLRRAGVPLRGAGLDPKQAAEVAHLYRAGWSSGRLAKRFDVSAHTVTCWRVAACQSRPPDRPFVSDARGREPCHRST